MIFTTKDGRVIRTGKHYTDFRETVWELQCGACAECGRCIPFDPEQFHVHHIHGRGMGSSKRNDIENEVQGLCLTCHGKKHQ